jgi:hypothetical protein
MLLKRANLHVQGAALAADRKLPVRCALADKPRLTAAGALTGLVSGTWPRAG